MCFLRCCWFRCWPGGGGMLLAALVAACGGYERPSLVTVAEEYAPSLGAGVNYSETKTFRTCVNTVEPIAEPAALERLYEETRVNTRHELDRALNVDTTVSARGLWGSADGGVSYFTNLEMNEDAFYWLVDARYTLSLEKLPTHAPEFSLTDSAKEILREHGVQAFYAACGTHFYLGRRLGARYTLLYEFNSREDKVSERLKARVSGTSTAWGVRASVEFSQFVQAAERASILKIHANILGGDHSVADYARTPDLLPGELEKLRQKLVEEKRGVVLEWYVNSYDMFPELLAAKKQDPGVKSEDHYRSEALAYYYDLYHRNAAAVRQIEGRLQQSLGEEPMFVYSDASRQQLQTLKNQYLEQNSEISRRASACLQLRSECPLEGLNSIAGVMPEPDKDLRGIGAWHLAPMQLSKSKLFVDMVGRPGGEFRPRIFATAQRLSSTNLGAVLLAARSDGRYESVHIGTFDPVIDPVTGKERIGLCVGAYASVCNLRIVESEAQKMSDGYPAAKMQLSLFNPDGFVIERIDFLIRE